MRILAFTDIHCSPAALDRIKEKVKTKNPDIIICSGDFTIFTRHTDAMLKKFQELGKPFYFTHGNHEDEAQIRSLVKKYSLLHFFHREACVLAGTLFLWYGGGGFSFRDKAFERFAPFFEKLIKKHDRIVMITHAPPYKTKLDPIVGQHCGNNSFKQFLVKHSAKISLYLCGHLHENFHKKDKVGNCVLVNAGPDGEIIELK